MELTIQVRQEDESYWAEVSELPGCFASGHTLDELAAGLEEAIRLYRDEPGSTALPEHSSIRIDRIHAIV